ncbi:MAG: hypothetical protein EP309_04245 [Gammaproteobacteria bacterium]|nr:MAG: hypothetical protein EP309_04245 [Gammaproteobacteria bacterium]
MTAVVEEVARKHGEQALLGGDIRSQADLALAVHHRLPLGVLKGLAQAGHPVTYCATGVMDDQVVSSQAYSHLRDHAVR